MRTTDDIVKEIRAWFEHHGWTFEEKAVDGDVVFLTHMAAADGLLFKGYAVRIIVYGSGKIQAVFLPPVTVPKKFVPAISEYFGRINAQFLLGKWVLDYGDGEPRWMLLKEVEHLKPGAEDVMDDLIGYSGTMCDKYAEGIVRIVMGNATPEELVRDDEEEHDGSDRNCRDGSEG